MKEKSLDSGFEKYRRDRRRKGSPAPAAAAPQPMDKQELARRQLEQAEAAEVQDQRLAREVKDFFEVATRTAADIVKKIAELQEAATTERISDEMHEFLMDTISRMQGVVEGLDDSDQVAEKHLEPLMHNLVGPMLDNFRLEGTAQLDDQHIGQNPFDTAVGKPGTKEQKKQKEPEAETPTLRREAAPPRSKKAAARKKVIAPEPETEPEKIEIEKVESVPGHSATQHPLPKHDLEPETVIEAGPEERKIKEDLPFDDPRF